MHPDKVEFFKFIYSDNDWRVVNKRSLSNDYIQWERNLELQAEEKSLEDNLLDPNNHQLYFIVGAPRTGSTFLSQLLIKAFNLGSQYNKVAKYYIVPLHGYNQVKKEEEKKAQFNSFLGNTDGDLNPHEFGYFWQYWLNFKLHHEPSVETLNQVDVFSLRKKLLAITNLLENDLLIKNQVYFNFIIVWVKQNFKNAKFIYINRNEFDVVESILNARMEQYGSYNYWWSLRPKHVSQWKNSPPIEQVCHQVLYTNNKIKEQLGFLNDEDYIEVNYDSLVEDVENELNRMASFFSREPINIDQFKTGIHRRIKSRHLPFSKSEILDNISKIKQQYD